MHIDDPAPGQVHVWLVFEHEFPDEELLLRYRPLLTEQERLQETRFYFPKDRRRYLITRALVRTVLSRYRDIDPRDWRFKKNQYGRPEIANFGEQHAPLWFNISHTAGMVVCGVATCQCVGVDTEALDRSRCPLEIADRYFSSLEVAELNSVPEALQVGRFFQYWTLKESYIKAQGMGLSLPLDQFSFNLSSPGEVTISFHAPLQDEPERLRFWLLQPSENHLVAVCVQRNENAPSSLIIRRIVPMNSEQLIEYPILRQTPRPAEYAASRSQ